MYTCGWVGSRFPMVYPALENTACNPCVSPASTALLSGSIPHHLYYSRLEFAAAAAAPDAAAAAAATAAAAIASASGGDYCNLTSPPLSIRQFSIVFSCWKVAPADLIILLLIPFIPQTTDKYITQGSFYLHFPN